MPEIRICGLKEIDVHRDWATHVISLVDSKEHVPTFDVPHLFEIFGDVNPKDPKDHFWSRIPLAKPIQIKRIHKFVKNLPEDARLLIHCHAGVGRSAATAIGVLCAWGHTPEQAIEIAAKIRPTMWPNEWILELWGNLLGIDGIPEKVEEWKKTEAEKGIFMPDFE